MVRLHRQLDVDLIPADVVGRLARGCPRGHEQQESAHCVVFLLPFLMFTNFALVNLVTAVVVEQVFAIAQKEAMKEAQSQERERCRTMRKLKQLFDDMDDDGNGMLDIDEFYTALQNPLVLQQFMQLGIAKYEAADLFECLDVDGHRELSVEEFIDGCFRTQGTSKAKHLLQVHYDLHRSRKVLRDEIASVQEFIQAKIAEVRGAKDGPERQDSACDSDQSGEESTAALMDRLDTVEQSLGVVNSKVAQGLQGASIAADEIKAARNAQRKVLDALRVGSHCGSLGDRSDICPSEVIQ